MKVRLARIEPYTTKDGSLIREIIHPNMQPNASMSLAEAVIMPGRTTALHTHGKSQEIYHVTRGRGRMTLGAERFAVRPGDSVLIARGVAHCVENTGKEPLKILCCCHVPYDHDDTVVLREYAD